MPKVLKSKDNLLKDAPALLSIKGMKILPKYPSDNNVMRIMFSHKELSDALKKSAEGKADKKEEVTEHSKTLDTETEKTTEVISTRSPPSEVENQINFINATPLNEIIQNTQPSLNDFEAVEASMEIANVTEITQQVREALAAEDENTENYEKLITVSENLSEDNVINSIQELRAPSNELVSTSVAVDSEKLPGWEEHTSTKEKPAAERSITNELPTQSTTEALSQPILTSYTCRSDTAVEVPKDLLAPNNLAMPSDTQSTEPTNAIREEEVKASQDPLTSSFSPSIQEVVPSTAAATIESIEATTSFLQVSSSSSTPVSVSSTTTMEDLTAATSPPEITTAAPSVKAKTVLSNISVAKPRQVCKTLRECRLNALQAETKPLLFRPNNKLLREFASKRPSLFSHHLTQKRNFKRAVGNEKKSVLDFVTPTPFNFKPSNIIEDLNAETSAERAERISKAVEKFMNVVTVAGHVDNYLTSRFRSGVRKFGKLFESQEEDDTKRRRNKPLFV